MAMAATHTDTAVVITDVRGRITWVNQGFERLSGYTLPELLGKSPGPLLQFEHTRSQEIERLRQALRRQAAFKGELLNRHKNGSAYWVALEIQPMLDEQGRLQGFMSLQQDVTERKQTEARLREQSERLNLILRSTGAGIWTHMLDEDRVLVDEQYAAMLGETVDTLQWSNRNLLERVHPDDRPALRLAQQQLADGQMQQEIEFRLRHADGHWVWVLSRSIVQSRHPDGRPAVIAGIHLDVSQRKGIEQQLLLQREELLGVIEGTQVGTWRWNVETGELQVNRNWALMLGHELEQLGPLTVTRWGEWVEASDLTRTMQAIERHLNGESAYFESEFRLRHRLGHWVWVQSRGKVIVTSPDGRPIWMAGTHTDVSAQKLIEAELKRANERFRLAARSAQIGVWEIDIASGDVIWNRQMRELFAIEDDLPSSELRRLWRTRVHPADLLHTHALLVDVLQWGKHYEAEFRVCWPTGEIRHLKSVGLVTESEGNERGRMVGIMQDVTDLRRKEAQLLASRAFLDNAGRIAGVGGWMVQGESMRLEWTSHTFRIHELTEGAQPTLEQALAFYPEPARQQFQDSLWLAFESGRSIDLELPLLTQTGNPRWVHVVAEAQFEGLKVVQVIGAMQDITERQAQRAALTHAKEMAESHSAAKSQFLANMSHEIRTPMNAILGMLALLKRTGLQTRQTDYVAKAEGASRALLGLINDILDFSKIEAGRMTLDPRPFSLDELLQNLSTLLSVNLNGKGLELMFDVDPALPDRLVGDDMRLQQVLLNLLSNAIKFTAQGEVLLKIELLRRSPHEVELELSVRDTGIGIATEHQEKIFSGFTQAEGSTTRRFGGTGLGLAISRHLLRLMGSDVQLLSVPGRGSIFSFALKLPLPEPEPAPAPEPPQAALGLNVLVVDDYGPARLLMQRMVQNLGCQCDVAADGEQALEYLLGARRRYDVVLLDWLMPGLDGWEVCQRLRSALPPEQRPKLVMVSAQGREQLLGQHKEQQHWLLAYLVKPPTSTMLRQALVQATQDADMAGAMDEASRERPLRLQGLRLLLAEDNPINQQIALELLQAEGAAVTLAGNGRAALRALGFDAADQPPGPDYEPPYDLVLMDLQMPEMDGLTAAEALRAGLGGRCPPIVAMTANAMESDRLDCLAAGMVDHVGKPFELDRLVQVLRRWTGLGQGGDTQAALAAAAGSTATAADDPAPLPVLEPAAALERMGGNRELYRRIVKQLLHDLPAYAVRMRAGPLEVPGPQSGGVVLAAAMDRLAELHTLKGLAGTVGAQALAHSAAQAERWLMQAPSASLQQQAQVLAGVAEAIDAAVAALAAASCAEPDHAYAAPSAPEAASDTPALRGTLLQLRACLLAFDLQALDLGQELEQHHASALGPRLPDLLQALQALDFSSALRLCEAYLEDNPD